MAVDGVMHSAPGAELIVLDTIVRDNGGSGIGGDADAALVLDHVRSEHNGTNGFYLASVTVQARAIDQRQRLRVQRLEWRVGRGAKLRPKYMLESSDRS